MKLPPSRKIVVVPGYQCNNRCVFCVNSDKRGLPARGTLEVKKEISAAAGRGCDYLEFAGGENTIRPDFFGLVSCAREAGFKKIAIATNGRMFSYPDFARRAEDSGVTTIIFSIHGHRARLHDGLTGVEGSFSELMRGMENVARNFKGTVATNTAITKKNYRSLPEIGKFIAGFELYNSEFIYADPTYGGVKNNFAALMPRISACAPYIRETLDLARDWPRSGGISGSGYNWSIRYAPLCYFARYYPFQISEARESRIYSNVQHSAPDYVNLDAIKGRKEIGRQKTAKCRECALYRKCEGIWKEYVKRYGDSELLPVKRTDL